MQTLKAILEAETGVPADQQLLSVTGKGLVDRSARAGSTAASSADWPLNALASRWGGAETSGYRDASGAAHLCLSERIVWGGLGVYLVHSVLPMSCRATMLGMCLRLCNPSDSHIPCLLRPNRVPFPRAAPRCRAVA